MTDPKEVINKQPEGRDLKDIKSEPKDDEISYVDSDTHAQTFCCCIHGWKTGPDPRWYYPYDKGMYLLLIVGCMWYCLCGFVPCILCNKTARDIVCCEGQCTEGRRHTAAEDEEGRYEIAEA